MIEKQRSGGDRRADSKQQIASLVTTRTATLSLLTGLAGQRPFTAEEATEEALQEFCQALIDYAATAHFQLYRHIEENQERRHSVLTIAEQFYPQILETTDHILSFNEKYEDPSLDGRLDGLVEDLSMLGEVLADRILVEDRVIKALHNERRESR